MFNQYQPQVVKVPFVVVIVKSSNMNVLFTYSCEEVNSMQAIILLRPQWLQLIVA